MTAAPDPTERTDWPAAFLPPPKRERKHFTDEPMFEAPATGLKRKDRLAAYADEALKENPDCGKSVPWRMTAKERRQWAEAVSYLLTGRRRR